MLSHHIHQSSTNTSKTTEEINITLNTAWSMALTAAKINGTDNSDYFRTAVASVKQNLGGIDSLDEANPSEEDAAFRGVMAPHFIETQTMRNTMVKAGAVGKLDMNVLEFLLLSTSDLSKLLLTQDVPSVEDYNNLVRSDRVKIGPTLMINKDTGKVQDSQGKLRAVSLYNEGGAFATITVYIILLNSDNEVVVKETFGDKTSPWLTEDSVPTTIKAQYHDSYAWFRQDNTFTHLSFCSSPDNALARADNKFFLPSNFVFDGKGGFIGADGAKFYNNTAFNSFGVTANRALPANTSVAPWKGSAIEAIIDKGFVRLGYRQNRGGPRPKYGDNVLRELIITGTAQSLAESSPAYKPTLAAIDFIAKQFADDIVIKVELIGYAWDIDYKYRSQEYRKSKEISGAGFAETLIRRMVSKVKKSSYEAQAYMEQVSSLALTDSETPNFLRKGDLTEHSGWLIPYCVSTGRVLIARRAGTVGFPNTWGHVGGSVSSIEEPLDAAVREAKEELQLSVDLKSVIPFMETSVKSDKSNTIHKSMIFIYFTNEESPVSLNGENDFAIWIEPSLLTSIENTHPVLESTVAKLLNFQESFKEEGLSDVDNMGIADKFLAINEGNQTPVTFDITFNVDDYNTANIYLYGGVSDDITGKRVRIGQVKVADGIETLHSLQVKGGYATNDLAALLMHLTDGLINPPTRLKIKPEQSAKELVPFYEKFGYEVSQEEPFVEMKRRTLGRGYGKFRT